MLQHLPVAPASAPSGATSVIYRHDSEHELRRTYHSRSSSPVHHASYVHRDRSPVIIKRTYSTEDLKHHPHQLQISPRDDLVDNDGDHHRIISAAHRHSEPRRYLIRHIEDEMGHDDEYERRSPVPLRESPELHHHRERHERTGGRYVVYEEEVVVEERRVKREPSVDAGVDEHEEEHDPDAPLDLSMKYKRNTRSDNCDSGSDSESDSSRHGQQRSSAYKKSLMKRYCE